MQERNVLLSDERTLLSNERTFLSYAHLAFTSLLLGLALLQIAQLPQFSQSLTSVGVFAIGLGVITAILGFFLYSKRKKEILRIEGRA